MKSPLLVLIDRVRVAVNALVEKAEAEWAVWDEKRGDAPLSEAHAADPRFQRDDATEAAKQVACDAFDRLQDERDTMGHIAVQLKGLGYDDAQAVNPGWYPPGAFFDHQRSLRAEARSFRCGTVECAKKTGQFGFFPKFVGDMREFEQALHKAHVFAQKRTTGGKAEKPKGALFNRSRGTLTLDGKPLSLSRGERLVLGRLVETGTASFSDLQNAHARPDRVLKRLREKHKGLMKHISCPGGPCKGGYSTTIEAEG